MICDLAETYGIYDYKALPPSTVAVLAIGLRDNSRVKMKLSGMKLTLEQSLMALILDNVRLSMWRGKGSKPKSIYKELTTDKQKDELRRFNSSEEFDAWMERKQRRNNG